MDPIRSVKNQYSGINAHLHSYWQSAGGWSEFHASYLIYLANALRAQLLPIGYTAAIEPSLQIRPLDAPAKTEYSASANELVLPLAETLLVEPISEKTFNAVKIYELTQRGPDRGEPIVWIEVLSPSNKPGGRDADEYLNKRLKIVESGIVFIEIDYLHESAPTLSGIPDYHIRRNRKSDANSYPYRILIVDPRPDVVAGVIRVSQFGVDDPLPTLSVALRGADVLSMDFAPSYHTTIQDTLYGFELVDYSKLPNNFDRYHQDDQRKIVNRMVAVLNAYDAGTDLETGPFTARELSLDAGLAELEKLT